MTSSRSASGCTVRRLGLLFVNAEGRGDFEDQRSISASYRACGSASLRCGCSALQTIEPERDLALVANLSIPLSPERSLTATGQYDGGDRRGRLEYRRSRGSSDLGPSYRLATEFGDDPRRLDGSLRYDAALASGQVTSSTATARRRCAAISRARSR